MGSRLVRFNFTPGENEQIETVVNVPEERRSVIHGIVKDHKNKVVKDAVVKLFEVMNPHDECALRAITHTFTDDCGQFLFGPLTACKHYAIKVWINNVKIRELIIRPDDDCKPHHDDCEDYCDEEEEKPHHGKKHKHDDDYEGKIPAHKYDDEDDD